MKSHANNPVFAKYQAKCSHPGCAGKLIFEQAHSAGLQVGATVPMDQTNPAFGRCPICLRHSMVVTQAPPPPQPKPPKGFTKIPTE